MSTNGRLLASELTSVEGVRLAIGTANAFLRMDAACLAATGVGLWPALPDGGYRDWATQANIAAKNPDSTVPIAAQGTSTHGWGTRIDIGSYGAKWGTDGAKREKWLLTHASEFGFHREFGDRDPNHFAHDGFTATAPIISAASAGGTTPIEEDDFMAGLTADEQRELLLNSRDITKAIGAGNARAWSDADAAKLAVLPHVKAAVTNTNDIKAALASLGVQVAGVDEAVWATQVGRLNADGKVVGVSALQELADAKTAALALATNGGIDLGKLADAIAAKIPGQAEQVDVAGIVRAELARVFVAAQA